MEENKKEKLDKIDELLESTSARSEEHTSELQSRI